MYERLTDRARKVMMLANQEAQRFNQEYVGTEYVLLGLMKEGSGVAATVLRYLDVDLQKVRNEIEKIVQAGPERVKMGKLPETPRAKKVIEYAIEEARYLNHNHVGTGHLLLGLLREQEGVAAQVLINLGLKLKDVRQEVLNLASADVGAGGEHGATSSGNKPKTPALDSFGRDFTDSALRGKLDPVVGREDEIGQIITILGQRNRNSAILVGELGVGRTAVVHGLAQLIADGLPIEYSRDTRIACFDIHLLISGAKDHADAENRLRAVVFELQRDKSIILFIPDLRGLIQTEDSLEATHYFRVFRRIRGLMMPS